MVLPETRHLPLWLGARAVEADLDDVDDWEARVIGRVSLGVLAGLAWLIALSGLEGVRLGWIEQGRVPWLALAAAVVAFVIATAALVQLPASFRYGVVTGLAIGLLFGVVVGHALFDALVPDFFTVPSTFGRAASSVSVWAALGVAVATSLLRPPTASRGSP